LGKKKGFLLPKVALTGKRDAQTIPSPKKAMMVYNTQTAGIGDQQVQANLVYVWTGQEWVPFSNLTEIRRLKKPIHFVLASKRRFEILNQDLVNFNDASKGMTVRWNTNEVYLNNEKDVKVIPNGNSFEEVEILTEAYYEFTGSFNFKSNADKATSVVALLQKKTTNGAWSTIASSSLPFEDGVQIWSQTLVFPVVTHKFKKGDRVRVVLKRGDGALQKAGAKIAYDPDNEGDVTMNARLTRLRNEGETHD